MLSFENDYSEGAHESILQALIDTNMEKLPGYGTDKYCDSAKAKIRAACQCPDADIFFLAGGTQTNQVVIDSMLKPYEGVIAADTGHVNTHEAGAIEFTGHKVLALPEHDGKIKAEELEEYLQVFYGDSNHEHMVFPGMVYVSHPTEYGTLYSKEELQDIHDICGGYNIPLFVDGARLGYGIAAAALSEDKKIANTVNAAEADHKAVKRITDLAELAANCDVFYIGGTKVGALCGEAVVFTRKNMPEHFVTIVKQHGALLAKGRLLGIQFDTLFTDNLYLKISEKAIRTAAELKKIFHEKGYSFFIDSPTNQIFIVLADDKLEKLQKNVRISFWEKYDDKHTVVRFATSWATTMEDIRELEKML